MYALQNIDEHKYPKCKLLQGVIFFLSNLL